RIFFHMNTGQADALGTFTNCDINVPVPGDGQLIHADLIPFGQIRVEIILARPAAVWRDLAMSCQRRAERVFHHTLVEDGEDAGHAEADRAGMIVWWRAELRGAAAENLRLGEQLGVDF